MRIYLVRWKDSGEWLGTGDYDTTFWFEKDLAEEALTDEANASSASYEELELVTFEQISELPKP